MSFQKLATAADDAAEAFYGQSEKTFLAQVQQMCGADQRLVKAFQMTRETYQQQSAHN